MTEVLQPLKTSVGHVPSARCEDGVQFELIEAESDARSNLQRLFILGRGGRPRPPETAQNARTDAVDGRQRSEGGWDLTVIRTHSSHRENSLTWSARLVAARRAACLRGVVRQP